jgi:hypothetical protein
VADLWPLKHMWTTSEDAEILRQIIDQHLAEAGAPPASRRRPEAELRADLALLESRAQGVRSPGALGAHLMALGRLRREAVIEHPDDTALRRDIEAAIARAMAALEEPHAHV